MNEYKLQQEIELLQDHLKKLAIALRPFALAADDNDVAASGDNAYLLILWRDENREEPVTINTEFDHEGDDLKVRHLRHARTVLQQTGFLEYD